MDTTVYRLDMPKQRAAWPKAIRFLATGIAVVVLALGIAWVLFVPAADWLAHHDVGPANRTLLLSARDDARSRLLTLAAGLLAAGALVFTAQTFIVSRRTLELTTQGQVTDRYTRAIEQLGSEKLDIRIGSIYALERIARDSARDHPTVVEVLSAFVREHSQEQWPPLSPDGEVPQRLTRPDVQAAISVVARRSQEHDVKSLDLTNANLTNASLIEAFLSRARLDGAILSRANLGGANLDASRLSRANLNGARLVGSHLNGAILSDAYLLGADLFGADLGSADIRRAYLSGADLTTADLHDANLTRAHLDRVNLSDANLSGADLTGASLTEADLSDATLTAANFTAVDLADAKWPRKVPLPHGWELNTSSGRLQLTRGIGRP